jgi:succinate dehydrogenase/fumarate reductase cytochrome b subunit
MRWLPLAVAVLGWHSLLAELGAAARAQPALRGPALLLAFALPFAGAAILLRGPDLGTRAGRRQRLWAHLATIAPVIATALRVPQVLPTRPVWLALFGAPLAVSLWRSRQGGAITPSAVAAAPPRLALKLHRGSAAVIVSFAALHFASHLSAAYSLALNSRVVDATRLVYKQRPVEALLLLALPVQIGTGLWLFRAARDRALDRWDRLQLASGLYLAVFLAAHATATAVLFRDITFRAASGGRPGLFGDPSFLAYYVLGPLAVFAHVACGARSLMLRRLGPVRAGRLATGVLGLGGAVTLVISLALCGIHLRNDRDKAQPRPARVGSR